MKKLFILLFAMMVMVPLNTFAATDYTFTDNCTNLENNQRKCTISVNITGTAIDTIVAEFVELGGADVDETTITASGAWEYNTLESTYPQATFTNDTAQTGTQELFTFVYTKSGQADCEVKINGATIDKPNTTPTTNEKGDDPQSGYALPYIALGGAALIAGYAFIATKNKNKMYKI